MRTVDRLRHMNLPARMLAVIRRTEGDRDGQLSMFAMLRINRVFCDRDHIECLRLG